MPDSTQLLNPPSTAPDGSASRDRVTCDRCHATVPQAGTVETVRGSTICDQCRRDYYWQCQAHEYERHHNGHRPHRGISNARSLHPLPEPITVPDTITRLDIRRRDRLGGVLHEYEHAA